MTSSGDALRTPLSPSLDGDGYDSFITQMGDFGLLDDLEDELPPGFTAIFEISRILQDPDSDLAARLAPALSLAHGEGTVTAEIEAMPEARRMSATVGEEYEAEFIRSWSDVRSIYAWQHLLPEEVFLRRLGNRTLWFPMAKSPTIRAIDVGDDDFNPNPAKQKVYVLLDTSASMQTRHRFSLAKAIVVHFLRRNRSDMGEVFLRTFDVTCGPLHAARDLPSFDALLHRVTRQSVLGNGTAMEKAIVTAAQDIHEQPGLAGAEILVITDGAAHLRERRVLPALGDDIRLHCVKIGGAAVYADDAYLQEKLEYGRVGDSRRDLRILQVREQKQKLERALEAESSAELRSTIQSALREIARTQGELANELREDYGCEIERLASVYVGIPDLDSAQIFSLTDDQLESLRAVVQQLLEDLAEVPARAEVLKQAALLLSHLNMLMREQADPALRRLLEELHQHLENEVESALEQHETRLNDGRMMSQSDQRDLRILLRRGTARYSSLWTLLLRLFYSTVSRWTGRGRP